MATCALQSQARKKSSKPMIRFSPCLRCLETEDGPERKVPDSKFEKVGLEKEMTKMLTKPMLFVIVALSSLAVARDKARDVLTEGASPSGYATSTCDVTFSSGSSTNATKFCVTVNGNIAQFSVAGGEMIAVGGVGEGYGICDTSTGVEYYDYAYLDSGNWLSPTFTHSGNVVTITRKTTDGIWQLKQTITNVPATAGGPGSAKVAMAVKEPEQRQPSGLSRALRGRGC
jgi:hypothetical protein